jgi:hypothetical protein
MSHNCSDLTVTVSVKWIESLYCKECILDSRRLTGAVGVGNTTVGRVPYLLLARQW